MIIQFLIGANVASFSLLSNVIMKMTHVKMRFRLPIASCLMLSSLILSPSKYVNDISSFSYFVLGQLTIFTLHPNI